jgi:Protein of unknown function (DUF4242)
MPRYLVERTFPDTLVIPQTDAGRAGCAGVVAVNTEHQVTWLHSYVSPDRTKTVCVYDGPTPQAIRDAAASNGLPVDTISEVTVLDPYFYTSGF